MIKNEFLNPSGKNFKSFSSIVDDILNMDETGLKKLKNLKKMKTLNQKSLR